MRKEYLTDPDYLRSEQYKDSANLDARIYLHENFSTNKLGFYRWTFKHIVNQMHQRILDLGCGPGDLWVKNADRIPDEWDITLSDLSKGMLEQARIRLIDLGISFPLTAGDAQKIPFSTHQFDTIIANHMLFHVPNRDDALSEIHRILRSNGRLIAATNGQSHLQRMQEMIQALDPENTVGLNLAYADNELPFSLENGRDQLEMHFQDVTIFRYKDALFVTEVQPLIDYIMSIPDVAEILRANPEKLEELRSTAKNEIALEGGIHISKDVGIFVAKK